MRIINALRSAKPSPSMVVAIAAVMIASAGSATAATVITGKQIRNGTVTGSDVRNHSLTSRDMARHAVSTRTLTQATVNELQATVATTKVSRSEPLQYHDDGTWDPKSLDVACPTGQIALGGGGGFVEVPSAAHVGASKPVVDASGTSVGWEVAGGPGISDNKTLEVYAICST